MVAWYRSNPEQMQNIEMGVLEEQVVDHIISKAQVETVDSNYDEVLAGKLMADIAAERAEAEETEETDAAPAAEASAAEDAAKDD